MSDEQVKNGRRAFLALGAGVILGGCVQGGTPGGGGAGQSTATQSESPSATADSGTITAAGTNRTEVTTNRPGAGPMTTEGGDATIIGIDSNDSEPQATATVGSGTDEGDSLGEQNGISVWNDADTARRITVAVEEEERSGEPLFQETSHFEPDAYVSIDVREPGEYAVSVGIEGEDPKIVDFPVDDCNAQSLFVTVTEDGTVESSAISTTRACDLVITTTETTDADTGD